MELQDLEKLLEYKFKDNSYLITALTHSSYANEKKKLKNNERLEFLGDSVLGIIVSDYIFKKYPDLPEGELTKMRASLVCEKSLYEYSKSIEVGKFLRLSKGEKCNNGAERSSILADSFEAILAAIYLDSNLDEARKFVLRFIPSQIEKSGREKAFKDYKTTLQEVVQKNPGEKVAYKLVKEKGPDHDKRFTVNVMLNSNIIGKGSGKSKKDAEQHAAQEALRLMGY